MTKNVLIIGATRGIGRYLALSYGQKKYNVFALAKFKNNLEKLDDDFAKHNYSAPTLIQNDLKNFKEVSLMTKALSETLAKRNEKVDLIIFSAYHPMSLSPIEHINFDDICANFNVRILSSMTILKGLKSKLVEGGRVVFITCKQYLDLANFYPYSAVNHAVESLAKTYCFENKAFGIRVGIFDPGLQMTGFHSKVYPNYNQESMKDKKMTFFNDFNKFVDGLKLGDCGYLKLSS